ncbi:hypothetical protein D1610_09145 [Sphingomonas gilva]|uniref:Uncharacterized protein n=1 Tax=Sphingomonas gilva TaxID=2305907 RepID=A0A396RMS2_9SPHN|nr:hypothetical protein [Sphingomonas gilva]RHW17609.1 hypothetical protein D1610_09145 [Sphingomonas gilva]
MRPVATKNWGPQYKDLSNLIGLKSVATRDNEARLKAEVAAHDGSHAYGRHGAQTGWEAQLIRAVTQITPDHAADPMGLNATIRRWNGGAMAYSDHDGSTIFDIFNDHGNPPVNPGTAAGTTAGGFMTPEAHFLARARGEAVVAGLTGPEHYAATYAFKTGKRMRAPINSVHIVVGPPRPGAPYGLGFARKDPRNYPRHSLEFVRKCIDGFHDRKTGDQLFPNVSAATYKFNMIALRRKRPLFESIDDLCAFFDLDLLWQGSCSLIYRRQHDPATHSHGGWRLITMFPDDLEPGWAPSLWLSDANKARLVANGMNRNVNDYRWTGHTSAMAGNPRRRYTPPNWI